MTKLDAIRGFFEAYARQDVGAVQEVMADDIVWTIPGHHPLSGPKRGITEVLAFFDQLARAGFQAQPLVIAESGEYVVDHHRGWSEAGLGVDQTWCLVFRFEGGRIKEVTNFASDQHAADRFFWSVYPLAPIPARLAAT
jgi:hypothetical protein